MTVHAVRFASATTQAENPDHVPEPAPPELPNVVPDRVQQHILDTFSEVLPEQASASSVLNTEMDGSGTDYLRGVRRFSDAEDKTAIVDAIEQNVVADASWYVIESHVCDHDEDDRSGCDGWTVEREKGDVPAEVYG